MSVTMSHPSMSALLTLTVVYFPRFEALATTVQSTADSLQKRRINTCLCGNVSAVQSIHCTQETKYIPPFNSLHQARSIHSVPDPRMGAVPWKDDQLAQYLGDCECITQIFCTREWAKTQGLLREDYGLEVNVLLCYVIKGTTSTVGFLPYLFKLTRTATLKGFQWTCNKRNNNLN